MKINELPDLFSMKIRERINSFPDEPILVQVKMLMTIDQNIYRIHFNLFNPQKVISQDKNAYNSRTASLCNELTDILKKTVLYKKVSAKNLVFIHIDEDDWFLYDINTEIKKVPDHEILDVKANSEYSNMIESSRKRKIYRIIADAGEKGVSQSDIYRKTRTFDKVERFKFINELLDEKAVVVRKEGDSKKKTEIYSLNFFNVE